MTCCIDLFYNCWASLYSLKCMWLFKYLERTQEERIITEAGQCAMTLTNNNHASVKPNEFFVLLCS